MATISTSECIKWDPENHVSNSTKPDEDATETHDLIGDREELDGADE